MNKNALFCDGTSDYVIPAEPGIHEKVRLRFRTARDDAQVDHIVPSFVNEEFRMRNFGVRQSRTDSNCHLRRHRNS